MRYGVTTVDIEMVAARLRGETVQEIARRLGVSKQRVSVRLARASRAILAAIERGERMAAAMRAARRVITAAEAAGEAISREVDAMPVEVLAIGTRARNILRKAGCITVGDVTRLRERDLLLMDWCGQKTVREIREALGAIGLDLAGGGRR